VSGGWLATVDEALDVAHEHWIWAEADGQTPASIIVALGGRLVGPRTSSDDAIAALAAHWREMHHQRKAA
jgi:hypothetical protein